MPDGGIAPHGARSMVGKSLLFPLSPEPGETLLGFLVRSAEHNYLPSPSPILSDLGVNLRLKGDCLSRLADDLPRLAEVLGRPLAEIRGLWGAEPLSGGRRRLGGVWLRPSMIFSSHRRLPRTFAPGSPDQAFWMVRNLGFCPQSWEQLADRCPRPWCGRRLTWCSANALHLCGFCGASVGEAKRQLIPAKDRAPLGWLAGLFSEEKSVVERTLQSLPPLFELENATDAYEVLSALAKPMGAFSNAERGGKTHGATNLAKACKFILEFPRSHWDLYQVEREVRADFRQRLERSAQGSGQGVVHRELERLLRYGRGRLKPSCVRTGSPEWFSISAAASFLKIQRSDVRRLIDSGNLSAAEEGGGEVRRHSVIKLSDITNLRFRIRERMSWREFCSRSGLPRGALEQLLAADLLRENADAAVTELFGDHHLERGRAEEFLTSAFYAPEHRTELSWLSLAQVMQGVGGREKPWARVIQAGLNGELPGGFRKDKEKTRSFSQLLVHPITARRLIMGGAAAQTPFNFQVGDLGEYWRPELTPGEVELYLNCTAQDVTWLRTRKLVSPVNEKGTAKRYARADIEAVGRQLITSREIAARLGLKAVDVWQVLQGLACGGAFGQGFFERDVIEPFISRELG